jgi:OOP family OmpA-OmpF porin
MKKHRAFIRVLSLTLLAGVLCSEPVQAETQEWFAHGYRQNHSLKGRRALSSMGTQYYFASPDPRPMDSDGDGVLDEYDACPGTPSGATVDERGCPYQVRMAPPNPDLDGDGVFNEADACPNTPRGATVDSYGCLYKPQVYVETNPDLDGDGVFNEADACPNTPRDAKVDRNGCWAIDNVYFDFDKSKVREPFKNDLDHVAHVLHYDPSITLELDGHTDRTGPEAYNKDLSVRRAMSVRSYLEGKMLDKNRMNIKGFGESLPIADNSTSHDRAMNRRVEIFPSIR